MAVSIYHNPKCQTSRMVLAALKDAGLDPTVILYLDTPPRGAEIVAIASGLNLPRRALRRWRGTPFDEPGLDDPSLPDEAIIAAILTHPLWLERPVVITPEGARLCGPLARVVETL